MIKVSAENINMSLIKAASLLRDQQREINRLNEVLSSKTRFEHAEKIASTAVQKGFLDTDEAKDYASSLASSEKDLDIVEDFVSRTAMGVPLSAGIKKVASENGNTDVLTTFLLTNETP